MERQILNKFIGKTIGILYKDSDKEIFARGVLEDVTENTILIRKIDGLLALDISTVIKIKE
jgi:ferredoxin-fold anticodon binding domain-containing protein